MTGESASRCWASQAKLGRRAGRRGSAYTACGKCTGLPAQALVEDELLRRGALHHAETRVVRRNGQLVAEGDDVGVDLDRLILAAGRWRWQYLASEPPPSPSIRISRGSCRNSRNPIILRVYANCSAYGSERRISLWMKARVKQSARAIVLDHEGPGVQPGEHAVHDRLAVAIARLEESDHTAFAGEGVGELEHVFQFACPMAEKRRSRRSPSRPSTMPGCAHHARKRSRVEPASAAAPPKRSLSSFT